MTRSRRNINDNSPISEGGSDEEVLSPGEASKDDSSGAASEQIRSELELKE